MLSEDRFNMRPLWNSLLNIYQEFAQVCDKHGLRYYWMEGNAIGAVRHKGFIPWDDDLDVAMPRPDYEKFVHLYQKELPPNLKFVDWHNAPDFTLPFGKIQETRKDCVEIIEKQVGFQLSNGLYIDILVVDGCPSGRMRRKIISSWIFLLGAMLRFKIEMFSRETKRGKAFWLLGGLLSCAFPWIFTADSVKKRVDTLLGTTSFETANLTWRVGGTLRLTFVFPRKIWDGVEMMEFDEIQVPLPKGWRDYLRIQYGDYMKLPPPDKQRPTHSYAWRCPWWLGPTMG